MVENLLKEANILISENKKQSFIVAKTMKTNFHTCTFMQSKVFVDGAEVLMDATNTTSEKKASSSYQQNIRKNQIFAIQKFGGYIVDRNHPKDALIEAAKEVLDKAVSFGFDSLLEMQKQSWAKIWESATRCELFVHVFYCVHLNLIFFDVQKYINKLVNTIFTHKYLQSL